MQAISILLARLRREDLMEVEQEGTNIRIVRKVGKTTQKGTTNSTRRLVRRRERDKGTSTDPRVSRVSSVQAGSPFALHF